MKNTLLAIATVLVAYFVSWGLITACVEPAQRGLFGDQFGAVNALFSGLAFAVILGALLQQHRESMEQGLRFKEQIQLQAFIEYSTITGHCGKVPGTKGWRLSNLEGQPSQLATSG